MGGSKFLLFKLTDVKYSVVFEKSKTERKYLIHFEKETGILNSVKGHRNHLWVLAEILFVC